jgi:ATP-dependent Clp protease adaptor protein ClpS
MSTQDNIAVEEKIKIDVPTPKLWKVVFLNDDHTPMELVIEILQTIFKHNLKDAQTITMTIHNEGSGIAGIYTHEIAETFALEATNMARRFGSPLKIQIEQE